MSKTKTCKWCGQVDPKHFPFQCFENPKVKNRKPIRKKGKQTLDYEKWRDEEAIPYLDKTYGRICAACGGARCNNENLDVDHKLNRGSHYHLRKSLTNIQYLGRSPCHQEKTDRIQLTYAK